MTIRVLIISLSMNVMMALAGVSLGGSDILTNFISTGNDNNPVDPVGNGYTTTEQFSLAQGSSLPTDLQNGAIGGGNAVGTGVTSTTGTAGYSFVDPIKMTFNGLMLLMVSLFIPVYWGVTLHLPLWLTYILLIQTIVGISAMILTFRGVSA